ncbi:MAG: SUMF1/EgtB/PvdO family nonheme iron enzyme [Acidobacteria bacterium]|nr:SUMF1/EgtB/PvdO family nonheme iron enzyme [Acidobacteriota bacterium]
MRECQVCRSCFSDTVLSCPNDGTATSHTIDGEPVLEGKYHLELRLGQGGMGVVYKARHAYLKTLHAIKIILPDLVGNDPQLVTRFRQEALAAAAIKHQNVVGVSDYGVINGTVPFLVMEYVEGESLHDLLTREGRLAPVRALELISAIGAGVAAAHHQGIVHRDLKPLNVMIITGRSDLSQSVKILDFGLAKIKSGELLGSFIQAKTTGLMGSPYYMAPEQWADEDPDTRADIYSLGVMLYQMLAGDVPFKGSSIPAIMKKHVSDPPPRLAEYGISIAPEIEAALRHTLEKDPEKRTPTVEAMIAELRAAILPQSVGGYALPVSSVNITTRPPRSDVFVDNVPFGSSADDGKLLLEGIQSGNHHLRVSHKGYRDWLADVVCDGSPINVVAELDTGSEAVPGAVPRPDMETLIQSVPPSVFQAQTIVQDSAAASMPGYAPTTSIPPVTQPEQGPQTEPQKKRSALSPVILGIAGIFILFVVGIAGVGAAYMLGLFGGRQTANVANTASPSPEPTPSAAPVIKAEMIEIPGGTFRMGNNEGEVNQRPEHAVTVPTFFMDKTEVTNAEYLDFVEETQHIAPKNWSNNRPVAGTENMPVAYVSYNDAVAFAAWRSDRDGVTYRLPTEEEWEYAARNGAKDDLFPWGNTFDPNKAVMNVKNAEPSAVDSKPSGKNVWGVVDLIGNVWEWTSSEPAAYPGSELDIKKTAEKRMMIRGGSANEDPVKLKITSAFRLDVAADRMEKNLGFRLVRPSADAK